MVFLLSDRNVQHYLVQQNFCGINESIQIKSQSCKNFNLIVSSQRDRFLIKQEPHQASGCVNGDLEHEWRVHELFQTHSEAADLRDCFSEAVYFDRDHAILVFRYLDDYCDLEEFYAQQRVFPPPIAAALGAVTAKIHRATLDREDYRTSLEGEQAKGEYVPDFARELAHLTPDIFAESPDALKFYELYQRYESLGRAIERLNQVYEPCCLTHNDLKLDNVLLQPSPSPRIRLIDWEKWAWGDPTADLGTLIASYLKIWLKRLPLSAAIDLEAALRLTDTPLERLQPSLVALTQAYVQHFPEIAQRIPDFLRRAMQFAGLALIERIQARLHYYEPFGNAEIGMLQVAKTLLCTPEQSIATVMGCAPTELLNAEVETAPQSAVVCLPPPTPRSTAPLHPQPHRFSPAERLADLIQHLQIKPDGCIEHAVYAASGFQNSGDETPVARLRHREELPRELQHRSLSRRLCNVLYDLYYSGELMLTQPSDADTLLENNAVRGINARFYAQLHRGNSGRGYYDLGWQVLRRTRNGFAVRKSGLTVYVQPGLHLPIEQRSPAVGDSVAIRLPASRIESGFYVAVGNAGAVPETATAIEFCFNVMPAGAIALMTALTQQLNALSLPFTFKVLADPAEYERYDTSVLQVDRCHYGQVRQIIQPLYAELRAQFRPAVPLFTKAIAAGISVAEEPNTEPSEFGVNRCHLVAEALLSVWQTAADTPAGRWQAIAQRFEQAGLDWQRPYLNPGSVDRFTALD